ncbi:hypothetical protein Pcinc_023514 [Petrolisthes cinctipes]|uniref:Uncharacterized protein n=2 Tax=Petrolisthes cinctipes TaxID=88211 RepID=A0AAE1FBN4_PETCI|nr:hypothetical protein Pcinc_023514 [Petrolisthes cinctipes]
MIRLFFENFSLCLAKDKLKEIELKEIKLEVSGELRKAVERATSPLFKRAFESVHTRSKNLKKLSLSMNKEALMSKTKIFQDKTENNLTPFDLHTGSLQMSKHATQKSKHAFINQHPTGTHSPGSNPPAPTPTTPTSFQTSLPDPQRELSYIFQDHLNTGTKLLPVSRGYYFIPGGKGQRLPLPLCISGQHKSVFHDLFCSIANSPLQSLTFLYPSLYLSVGDLVCLGDCVRRSKHLTRLKLPNLKSIESYMPILLAVGGSNAIQTLRIDSNTVSVWDKAFQLAVTSLRHNSTLRTLSLAHWTFDLQVGVRNSV